MSMDPESTEGGEVSPPPNETPRQIEIRLAQSVTPVERPAPPVYLCPRCGTSMQVDPDGKPFSTEELRQWIRDRDA